MSAKEITMTNTIIVDGKVYERTKNYRQKFNPLDMCIVEGSEEELEDSFDFVGWELPIDEEIWFYELDPGSFTISASYTLEEKK
jgi:hypothetical protein